MTIIAIESKADFTSKILSTTDLVVLDCWATWCGPCKAIEPKLEEFSAAFSQVKFYKLNVDDPAVADVVQELNVRAMPTVMFFEKGEKVTEIVGADLHGIERGIQALVATLV
ncbi:thioredoxin [Penicillium argentinense]|uniref:Thioredoxin n=1 Tax=Penicillium argentinense TaxID=1131581 RepID=A0A9W9G0H0_9EURO|nr:thioredoxin [Penicillium argentinense]KAJ5109856.1 thioredoxin [Penicillium argentinense]